MSKIHLIGNAHLDPVWLWKWQEGYAEVLATFRSALDRIAEFDDFVFTCAGAMYYQWVEETDPEMFEEIKQRVAEGRWVIVGGWMIQPDCNIPCGESFARHALYSQNYYKEKFGVTANVGYNVDSFGHTAMLPQILKHSGLDAYVFMRPGPHEYALPFNNINFMWKSPDGTSIPTFRVLDPYCSKGFGESAERAIEAKQAAESMDIPQIMGFYGVGNHGGGPTIKNILALKELMKGEGGEDYIFSSPNRYFAELDTSSLPEYEGDLHHHASGGYSAAMHVKELNRMSEAHLANAEKAGLMALLSGVKKSAENLESAWRPALFNHFHDIAAGVCIKSGISDAVQFFGSSLYAADAAQNRALQAIAWNIDTSKGNPVALEKTDFKLWEKDDAGVPIVVFNMNSFPVTAPVKLACMLSSVEDDNGNPVPTQKTRAEMNNGSELWESEIIATVPPMGWQLYWGYKDKAPKAEFPDEKLAGRKLENEFLEVDISEDGFINRIFDKKAQKLLLDGKLCPIVIDETECDTWAHMKFSFTNEVGCFKNAEILNSVSGAIRRELRIKYTYNSSELILDIALYDGLPELYIKASLNWQEKHKMLKFALPTPFRGARDTASVPFGFTVRKADGKEQTMQKWVCAKENGYGIAVATDSRSAYDFKDGMLRITAVRSPAYADHYGERDCYIEHTDIGLHQFRLAIGAAGDDLTHVYRLAEALLTPLPTITGTYHKGSLESSGSILEFSADNISATAFKPAEDGNGYILRCHEIAGRDTECTLSVPVLGINSPLSFRAQEIKTLRIIGGAISETDFTEN